MTDLSLSQLSYFAAKAKLPEKLVLDTSRRTVEAFMDVWSDRKAAREADPDLFGPIARHLLRIPLVREVGFQLVLPK